MTKRIYSLISCLLCAMMIFSVVPGVSAENQSEGICGESLTWKVENDSLIISGTGAMDDYEELYGPRKDGKRGYLGVSSPWYDETFSRVIVEEGVTTLGNNAFNNNPSLVSVQLPQTLISIGTGVFGGDGNLRDINLPDSIISIGSNAFSCCGDLTRIILPDSLTTIESGTFQSCKGLIDFTVPDSVTVIDFYAFGNCRCLENVTLPASVTRIDPDAFSECNNLQNITVVRNSYAEQFCEKNNLPFTSVEKLPEKSNAAVSNATGITWKVENGILTISGTGPMENYEHIHDEINADGSFQSLGITSPWDKEKFTRIVVENGVTSIGNMAFYGHTEVTQVSLPDTLAYIGDYAFEDLTKLAEIRIPDSVTHIGACAFMFCDNLKEITLPSSVRSVGTRAFLHCSNLEHIYLPASVHDIGFEVFDSCVRLKSITVEQGSYAEQFCINNKLPYDYGDSSQIHSAGAGNPSISWKVENGTLTISGKGEMDDYREIMVIHEDDHGYEYIGSDAPWYNETYNRIVIENGITTIGDNTFRNKKSINSVTLPDTLVSIGQEAFGGCLNLETINLPDSITAIKQNAFSGCLKLQNLTLPASLTKIGFGAFQSCKSLTEITIPDSVTAIDDYAFGRCFALEKVSLPAFATKIGDSTFAGCDNLKRIIVEKGSYAEHYCVNNSLPYEYSDNSEDSADISGGLYTSELGVRFGMTPRTVQIIESGHQRTPKGTYQSADSYQLYYDYDVHFYTIQCSRMEYDFDIFDKLLYQVEYVSKGGAEDYSKALSLISSQYGNPVPDKAGTGKYSDTYERLGGKENSHIEAAHWLFPEEDKHLGIDLWYNDYDVVTIIFYDTNSPASYGDLPKLFVDDETGIRFSYYLDGWDAFHKSSYIPSVDATYILDEDPKTVIQYRHQDFWKQFESTGLKREDYNIDFLSDEFLHTLLKPEINNIRTQSFGGTEFRMFEYQSVNQKTSDTFFCTVAITMKDACLHVFTFSSVSKHDDCLPALEQLLSTVEFAR